LRDISFLAGWLALAGVNPFNLISWFFVFVMLIEPKTSAVVELRGAIFSATAALGSFLIYTFWPGYDLFVVGLAAANLTRPFFTRKKSQIKISRGEKSRQKVVEIS